MWDVILDIKIQVWVESHLNVLLWDKDWTEIQGLIKSYFNHISLNITLLNHEF